MLHSFRVELEEGHWHRAFEYAEGARHVEGDSARAIMAEAGARGGLMLSTRSPNTSMR
jgi:hypothetical protein